MVEIGKAKEVVNDDVVSVRLTVETTRMTQR